MPIQVWDRSESIPQCYIDTIKKVSSMDDVDWVAFLPIKYSGMYIPWLEEPHFGPMVEQIDFRGGKIIVGRHA